MNCPDCAVGPGGLHDTGCDVERCVLCGGQAISCGCVYRVNGIDRDTLKDTHPKVYVEGPTNGMLVKLGSEEEKFGGPLPWTGIWPGTEECNEFGWHSKWVDGSGWVRCEADDPEAGPDLNRLMREAKWDRTQRRWVRGVE